MIRLRLRYSIGFLACSIFAQWMKFDNVTVSSFSATPSARKLTTTTTTGDHQHNAIMVVLIDHKGRHYRQQQYNTNLYVSLNLSARGRSSRSSTLYALPCDIASSTLLTSVVEYFDGSTIIDPVVVSNVFWSRLQANILSVIVGQFLAAIVFSFLLSTAASQITKLLSFVSDQIFTIAAPTRENQSPLRIPRNLRDDSSTSVLVRPDFGKLLLCIIIDSIGSSSMLLPLIGDASDVLWAPIAGLLLRYLFYNSNVILVFEFAEEILPFTDILPLATLCWIVDTYFRETDIAKLLQLGAYASSSSFTNADRSNVIDVDDNARDRSKK
jgi:hypothetical protein